MKWFRTVILLAVPVFAFGCLPTTPEDLAVGVALLGFSCVLVGLRYSSRLLKVEESKTVARLFLAAVLLIGGGLIALGGRWAGWWGQ
jgi:hypothetical protein